MGKVATLSRFDNFKAYHLRGKHGKMGHLRVRNNFKAYHLRGKHGKSGSHLRVRQF